MVANFEMAEIAWHAWNKRAAERLKEMHEEQKRERLHPKGTGVCCLVEGEEPDTGFYIGPVAGRPGIHYVYFPHWDVALSGVNVAQVDGRFIRVPVMPNI